MELSEARRSLAEMSEEITKFGESLDLDALNDEIAANEDEMVHPD
ncbi:MAG: peptide chain release factor 2, partial [Weissella confusa]|nr:peptide chain release factor 2 [Weissella confusa]